MKQYLKIDKKPLKGLMYFEWAVMIYLVLTLGVTLFCYTSLPNAGGMISTRIAALLSTLLGMGVYRLLPCRLTVILRVAIQLLWLIEWYPDTYEINRVLPNLDHIFAGWEQSVFGCQPALVFSQTCPWGWFSELMHLGYASYYPCMVAVLAYYLFYRYHEFTKATFIVMGSFFIYYIFYDIVPVTGPQYYYQAVGVDQIAQGIFPDVGSYFFNHKECLDLPGMKDGFFHGLVQAAHNTGERPTAAFPSSHVGITTICMLLLIHGKSRKGLYTYLPIYFLLCLSTVYIQAHYAIDAIAGFFSGIALYYGLNLVNVKENA